MDTAARGADLVARILTFSRQNEPERKTLDLNREIAEILKVLSKAVPKDVTFDVGLAADISPVLAAPDQIHQIVMNLCANAWDAMPGGGTIRIRTRNMEWPEELRKELPDAAMGNCVELSVGDTGTGIDPKTMERIFDPFFTTKPTGVGTGLGLSVSRKIVELHGGTLDIRNRPEGGVRATILLKEHKS
jgi:signal transduction histidine kinase